MSTEKKALPPVVSREEWQASVERLRLEEKALTRAHDALNAKRRWLPMVKIEKDYTFEGEEGKVSFVDLFAGRPQLMIYHFMFAPDWEEGCNGCSMMVDNMGHPAHLEARGVTRVLVSRAPLEKLLNFRKRMGWTIPWYSSAGTSFNRDFGATTDEGEEHRLSVFLRDGDSVYQTYFTEARGAEYMGSNFTYLDLAPYGRQEEWEDSPEGWPQTPTYTWWRHHDRY